MVGNFSIALAGILFALQLAQPAQAVVTINGLDGNRISGFTGSLPAASGTGLTVFGGLAGPDTLCTNVNATCPSCDSLSTGQYKACNQRRIHSNLRFIVQFTSDKSAGIPRIAKDESPYTVLTHENDSPTASVAQGTQTYAIVTWDYICQALNGGSSCPSSSSDTGYAGFTGNLRIGVDTNSDGKLDTGDDYATVKFTIQKKFGDNAAGDSYTEDEDSTYSGIFHFEARAGDGKVTIKNIKSASALPSLGDSNSGTSVPYATKAKYVRIYYVSSSNTTYDNTNFSRVGPWQGGGTPEDLPISSSTVSGATEVSVSPATVTKLSNSTAEAPIAYYFKSALVDEAGNIGFFTAPIGTAQYSTDEFCSYATNPSSTTCHFAQPGEVLGVLENNVNCFIATAAYGSPFSSHVVDLRAFRDQFLLPSELGRGFVRWYYTHSPPAAKWIADRPMIRATVRGLLWPIWSFAAFSLEFGLGAAAGLILVLSGGIAGLCIAIRKRRQRRSA